MDPNGPPPTGSMPPSHYPPMGGPKPPAPTAMPPAFNPDPSGNPPMHFKQGNMPQQLMGMPPTSMINPQMAHIT